MGNKENLRISLNVRLEAKEKEKLRKHCIKKGITISDWIRERLKEVK